MVRSFDPAVPTDGPEHLLDVDDPWYGPQEAFEQTLAEIEAAADGVLGPRARGSERLKSPW